MTRKTHFSRPYPDWSWTICGRLIVFAQGISSRPSCKNCRRILAAAKRK